MIDDFHREVQAADEAQLGTLDGMAKKRVCQRNQGVWSSAAALRLNAS
jgi:hypothetical protein